MQVFKTTNEAARELGVSEVRLRAMRGRGELLHSARTSRGDALYSQSDIDRAKERLSRQGASNGAGGRPAN
jgi:DNA-binding transcriptional MerR regulator